jgi:type I restriction enzyme S subunit
MDTPEDISIPENWVSTTLGDIRLEKKQSIVPNKTPDQIFELYSVPNFVLGKPEFILGKEIGSNKQVVEEDTVLLCKINPRINRVWIVSNFSSYKKIASTEWISFSKLDGVLPKYLCYFMQNNIFRDFLTLNVSGVGGSLMRIKAPTITGYPFPLPPLPEQHRIVARIEQLFTNLDAGVESLKAARAQLKRYHQSVLKSACEGRLVPTEAEMARAEEREYEPAEVLLERILEERQRKWGENNKGKKYKEPSVPDINGCPELPEGWKWTISDYIFWFVTSGSRGWAKYYSDAGPVFLRVGNLDHDSISLDLSNIQRVQPPTGTEGIRTRIVAGDILISITADVGMIALVPSDIEESYINQHVSLARPVSAVNPHYLAWFLASRDGGQNQFIQLQRGATKKGLGLNDIRSIKIPLPPFAEQQRIISEVERRLSVADEMEKTIEQSLKQAERLRQSILKRAFEGKLVPQDLEDESASVLLERIRAEKAQREVEEKTKKRRNTKNIKMMEVIKEAKKVIKVEGLYDILLCSKKPLTPKQLWQLSNLDIEEFYAQLKVEVEKGRVIESRPNDSDVYLEIEK